MDQFISNTMQEWNKGLKNGWAFAQPDCAQAVYPAQFVVVTEPRIALATIQILQ